MPSPIEERFIIETENALGLKFPETFRRCMMIDNGGTVETPPDAWRLYPFWDKSDKKRLKRTCNDIIRETGEAGKWEMFPTNAIAIGENGCGDRLVFLRSPENPSELKPDVYWWDHETGRVHHIVEDFSHLR